jgi:dihydroxyacetone kinase-like protein
MLVATRDVLAWLRGLRQVYAAHRQYLTDLDAAIGDADHGSNMDRGFTAVDAELAERPPREIGTALQTTASVLLKSVGGASGPLFGTFFLRAGGACTGKAELDAAGVLALFQAGVEGVQQRGKAVAGDKTMLDALLPAVMVMRWTMDSSGDLVAMMQAGAKAAEEGMLSTAPMQARKGRASYLGARSVGHQDPGATSVFLMIRAAADLWRPQA